VPVQAGLFDRRAVRQAEEARRRAERDLEEGRRRLDVLDCAADVRLAGAPELLMALGVAL